MNIFGKRSILVQSKIWWEGNRQKTRRETSHCFLQGGNALHAAPKNISCTAHTTVMKMLATVIRITPNHTAKSSIDTLSLNFINVSNSWSSIAIWTVESIRHVRSKLRTVLTTRLTDAAFAKPVYIVICNMHMYINNSHA